MMEILDVYKRQVLKLAHEYDLPIRQETYLQKDFEPVYFEELFYNQDATFEMINMILHKNVENYELMCHPAMIDWLSLIHI